MSKEYVRIQSKVNIKVVPGLQHEDVTNPDAHIADRLKISALWPKMAILLKEGVGTYPAYIAEWNTVKALAKDKIITIGDFVDGAEDREVQEKSKLDIEIAEVESKLKKKVNKTVAKLSEIAGE